MSTWPADIPIDPDLTPAQEALKAFTDEVLALKTPNLATWFDVIPSVDPEEVQVKLRASMLGELMLQDGDSLSAVPPDDYHRDLGLFVGQATLISVGLRIYDWDANKYRVNPITSKPGNIDVVEIQGEKDWSRKAEIRLWYSNWPQEACQVVSSHSSSETAGHIPTLSRDVLAPAYADMGFDCHNRLMLGDYTETAVFDFLGIARELFESSGEVETP